MQTKVPVCSPAPSVEALDEQTGVKIEKHMYGAAYTAVWKKQVEMKCLTPPLSHTVIPYHFTLSTANERDADTTARVYVILIGPNDVETERLWMDLPDGKKCFAAGTMEKFVSYGNDVGELKRVEVR